MEPSIIPPSAGTVKRKKRPLWILLSILSVLLIVVLLVVVIFPSVVLRHIFSRVESQTGIALTFDRAYFYLSEGSFLAIDGLAAKRQNHHDSNFDFTAASVRMPAMVPADFYSPTILVSGLHGTYERVGKDSETTTDSTTSDSFVKTLILSDAEIVFIDRTPEKPFRTTIFIKEFWAVCDHRPSLFDPFTCSMQGQIDTAAARVDWTENEKQKIVVSRVPIQLFVPYAPVLSDIFDAGSFNIQVDDLSDETQKKIHIALVLLSDCEIKPADEILAPAIQAALQKLDQSSIPALHDLKGKIDRLKNFMESLHPKLDKVAQIVARLKVLAPPDVRAEYEKFNSEFDRAKTVAESWTALMHDLDAIKANIVSDTFQHFVASGRPIEIDLHQENAEWQCDWYDVVVRLVEKNYREIIETQYVKRIQEIRDAVERFL